MNNKIKGVNHKTKIELKLMTKLYSTSLSTIKG